MFDTVKIGKKIALLRKQKNITQFELADTLGISTQAVSNWERGVSMPDISKLPELSAYFGITIDSILDTNNAVICNTVNGNTGCKYTNEDIIEVASILRPEDLKNLIIESARNSGCVYSTSEARELLPYVDEETADMLGIQATEQEFNADDLEKTYVSYMTKSGIDRAAQILANRGMDVSRLAEYMTREGVDTVAVILAERGMNIDDLAEYMTKPGVAHAAQILANNGKDVQQLAEFMTPDGVDAVAEILAENGTNIDDLAEYMTKPGVDHAAQILANIGMDVSRLAEFMTPEGVDAVAKILAEQIDKI